MKKKKKTLPTKSITFDVVGAGTVRLGGNALSRCANAVGVCFDVLWSRFEMSGGVMDRPEMIRLRNHLNELLEQR